MVDIYIGSGIVAIMFIIFQMVVMAIDIDIGTPAINRPGGLGDGTTYIVFDNAANATGNITSIEIWCVSNLTGTKVATFYRPDPDGYPSNFTTRDYVTLPTVVSGAKRTFTLDSESNPISLGVEIGDYIGFVFTNGTIENTSGTAGHDLKRTFSVDNIPCSNVTFTAIANNTLSLYGTGVTAEEEANTIFFGSNF